MRRRKDERKRKKDERKWRWTLRTRLEMRMETTSAETKHTIDPEKTLIDFH